MSKNTWLAIGAVVILLVLIFVLADGGDDTVEPTVDTETPADVTPVDETDVTDEGDEMTDTTGTEVESDVQIQ
jgi:hypothetical protein